MAFKKFPKHYSTFARQTEGLVGKGKAAPTPLYHDNRAKRLVEAEYEKYPSMFTYEGEISLTMVSEYMQDIADASPANADEWAYEWAITKEAFTDGGALLPPEPRPTPVEQEARAAAVLGEKILTLKGKQVRITRLKYTFDGQVVAVRYQNAGAYSIMWNRAIGPQQWAPNAPESTMRFFTTSPLQIEMLLKGEYAYVRDPDGNECSIRLVSVVNPPKPPQPSNRLALAKAKVRVAAAALELERAAPAARPAIVATAIDYDLQRDANPWQIPGSWAAKLPQNHFEFLCDVTARQCVVETVDRGRWNPVKVAADQYQLHEVRQVRELLELSSVHLARTTLLPLRRNPGADFAPFLERLEALYRRQFSLADLKTSTTLLNQQYSTPSPLSGILGEWIARRHPNVLGGAIEGAMETPRTAQILEPTAGNGLLTVRFDPQLVAVNELEETRLHHLQAQPFHRVTGYDAASSDQAKMIGTMVQQFKGVITNPPFGSTSAQTVYHRNGSTGYKLTGWEHVIAAHAVNRLADDGRAAIIIGGHHQFNDNGKLVGRDWIFFNYLYAHFHVAHVLMLDAHKLYARQGATWPIRVILLDGCKKPVGGHAPLGVKDGPQPIISSYQQLALTLGLLS